MQTLLRGSYRWEQNVAFFLTMAIGLWAVPNPKAIAGQDNDRLNVGVLFRFMPAGWMNASELSKPDIRSVPALGGALFVDYSLHRFFSVGAMPELTLNVIPKVLGDYPVSALAGGSLRLKAQYPAWNYVTPYFLFAPGYSIIWSYKQAILTCDCADNIKIENIENGDSQGFMLAGYVGLRVMVTPRHAVIAEAGYLHGFQKESGRSYAPSYLVIALGWQTSL